jgi:protocatechuate 3,4-dioxygenase beta subunit
MLKSIWQKLFSRKTSRRPRRAAPKARFRPVVEGLEERAVPATGGISGTVFQDLTGNGLSAAHSPESGVKVKVYADTDHNGHLDRHDRLVASQYTGADGSYFFSNLAPGTYFVTERTPGGFVRTAPLTSSDYAVHVTAGQTAGGLDFANFHKPDRGVVTHVSFTVTAPDGTQTVVTNLRGHTQQGDTVTAHFTVSPHARGPVLLTLAAYDAPGATFDAAVASQQKLDNVASGTFQPGQTGSLTVTVPGNFYQVDFVLGNAITQFGPAGSNVFYSAQHRLLSADNGGTQAVAGSTVSGRVVADTGATVAGATVQLAGTSDSGVAVNEVVPSQADGTYSFTGLLPGTYTLTISPTSSNFVSTPVVLTVVVGSGGTVTVPDAVLTTASGGGGL